MNRFFGRFTKTITKPQQMYPIGVLFGLGFDTATEVALLVIAGSAGAAGLPWYAILCLPVLFAAGMSLMDTIDGSFMNFAYGWAFSKPVRKVFYNITITGLSVAVALVIGTIELGGLIASELKLSGSFWNWFENININLLGFVIVGMFVATWAIALSIWRFGHIEERWSAHLEKPTPSGQGRADCPAMTHAPEVTRLRFRDARRGDQRDAPPWPARLDLAPARARCAVRRGRPVLRRAPRTQRSTSTWRPFYRNLDVFERHGLVQHVHLGHGPGLYVLVGRRRARVPLLRELLRGPCARAGGARRPALLADETDSDTARASPITRSSEPAGTAPRRRPPPDAHASRAQPRRLRPFARRSTGAQSQARRCARQRLTRTLTRRC